MRKKIVETDFIERRESEDIKQNNFLKKEIVRLKKILREKGCFDIQLKVLCNHLSGYFRTKGNHIYFIEYDNIFDKLKLSTTKTFNPFLFMGRKRQDILTFNLK